MVGGPGCDAVPGNPLQDIRRLEHPGFVMKDGAVVRHDRPGGNLQPFWGLPEKLIGSFGTRYFEIALARSVL